MNNAFFIRVDESDIRRINNMLGDFRGVPERVTVRALNKTLTGVRTDASAAVRAEVTAKKAAVDKTFKIQKATSANMRAVISSTGKPLALIDYAARETKKGVSVQVRKDKPRKVVPGAFVATMGSGHKGVFWRRWHENRGIKLNKTETAISRSGFVWSSRAQRYIPMAALPRKYRLKIEERYGPRIPDIMSNAPVMKEILNQAGERLRDNLRHETEYEVNRHK